MNNVSGECRASKVAIIGTGFVGSSAAYALMLGGVVSHLSLIDLNKKKAEGEMLDLAHCMQFTTLSEIEAGSDYALVKNADIVVVTAGMAQKPGQSRAELLAINVNLFKEIIPQIVKNNPDCIIMVVTNPLDVMTYVAWKLSGFPAHRVFGTGTVLDTARLRYLIGKSFEISPKDVSAYVLGEHGDSEFVWWSRATIAGVELNKFPEYSEELLQQIADKTYRSVYDVIEKKGATYYAIALVISKLVNAMLTGQTRVFTVSRYVESLYDASDICIGLPTIVNKSGACNFLDIDLNDQEQLLFKHSAQKIKLGIEQAKKIIGC